MWWDVRRSRAGGTREPVATQVRNGTFTDMRGNKTMRSMGRLREASRPDRWQILATGAGLAAALVAARAAPAQDTSGANADFLFVQTAKSMAFDADRNRLTLNGVAATTLFFSDRPERIARNMTTEAFVPFWGEGKDSFLSDRPVPTSRSSRTTRCARLLSSSRIRCSRATPCTTR